MGPRPTANYSSSAGDHGGPGEEQCPGTVAMFYAVAEAAVLLPGIAI